MLLLSDGAVGEDCGWISDELLSWNTADMDDLAGHIARLASLRMTDNTKDDITVVAVNNHDLKQKLAVYQEKEKTLTEQIEAEKNRTEEIEDGLKNMDYL